MNSNLNKKNLFPTKSITPESRASVTSSNDFAAPPAHNHMEHMKSYTLESISSTTIHGIDQLFKPNKRIGLKLVWLVFLVASTGGCAYFIVNSTIEYFRYEVVTKIQVFNEKPQIFPTVAICNLNIFSTPQTIEFGRRLLASNDLGDPFANTSSTGLNFTLAQVNLLVKYLLSVNLKNPMLNNSDLQLFNTSFDDFVISCTFNLLPCYSHMFKPYFDENLGSCYLFNFEGIQPEPFYSSRPGFLNSFKIELFLPELTDPYSFATVAGAYVTIMNASQTKIDFNGITAPVGTKTFIGVTKKRFFFHFFIFNRILSKIIIIINKTKKEK